MGQQARDYWKGTITTARDSAGGLDEGDVTQFTTPATDGTPQCIKPSGTAPWLQTFLGIVLPRGVIGGSGASAGEDLGVKMQGFGRVKLGANRAMTRGAQLINDASTLGAVMARTAYSFSANVIGYAQEALSSSASAQMLEALVQPHAVEIVRPVFSVATDATVGAATKYMAGVGVALSGSSVPLGVVRFTGEVVRNLWVSTGTAAGNTETLVATVIKSSDNGGTWTDTAVTCTVTGNAGGTAKSASDLSNSASLAAGDLVGLKLVSSAGTVGLVRAGFDLT